MPRLILALTASLLLALLAGSASAQTGPQFRLGFQTLATLIPNVAGQPLEDEHHSPANGDGLQRTTTGLMVWRKADNFTAFTDGSTTWLIGPFGLQGRPNDARFDWERATLSVLNEEAVSLAFARTPDGLWAGQGSVQNPTGEAMDVEIDVAAYGAPGGAPLMDAPTVFVRGLAPGESRPIGVQVMTRSDVGSWKWRVYSRSSTVRGSTLADVGTTRPLNLDPALAGTVDALRSVDGGDWLVRVAAENGVRVRRAPTPDGVLGDFQPDPGLVNVSTQLDSSSAWVRSAVLAHELQHAASAAAGVMPATSRQCLNFETEAFQRQAAVWSALWQGHLPGDVDPMHTELNDVAVTVVQNPQLFAAQLARRYRSECGALP